MLSRLFLNAYNMGKKRICNIFAYKTNAVFEVRCKRQAQESDPSALTQKLCAGCNINNFELQKMQ